MTKKICDSCKKKLGKDFVSISLGHFYDYKEFCRACQSAAIVYVKKLYSARDERQGADVD